MRAIPLPRIIRKPSGVESAIVLRAHRRNVDNSQLKRTACQVYGALCDCLDYSRYTGLAWPKVETLARRLHVTVRTVQRGLEELLFAGWIGTPCGDSGGSREGILYHLHPDGKPCLFCLAAARTLNQRGKSGCGKTGDTMTPVIRTGDNSSSVQIAQKSGELSARGVKSTPVQAPRGDNFAARGDKNDRACKERRFLSNLSKSSSTPSGELPLDFAKQMDQEVTLDRGALLKLWRTAHEIQPDVTGEEIRHFFHQRAVSVYRNRKLENPTGLMLATIGDWFEPRRVLERREEVRQAAMACEALKAQLSEMGIVRPEPRPIDTGEPEIDQSMRSRIAEVGGRKRLR